MKNYLKKEWILIYFFCLCISIHSQETTECSVNLSSLKLNYKIGRFDFVEESLQGKLKDCPISFREEGYRLLAMNSIAMDSIDAAKKYIKKLLKINGNYQERLQDPILFKQLLERLRVGSVPKVTSVSKFAENLNEAPANIKIVTREEIKERGYMDLEQVFHDLPGFDISRTSGGTYSSMYMGGYRTFNNNDRTLFLIDGIEDNDLFSNKIWLSRQYPLSNLKQVDVIYGPASTMYGANAFTGVINLTTLTPSDLIPSLKESIGITGFYELASFNTKAADVTIAFRKNKLSGTVTGRFFHSDEFDRSGFDDFDYKYSPLSLSHYQGLKMDIDSTITANEYVTINTAENYASYTLLGAQKARELDSIGFATDGVYEDIRYSNRTRDHYLLAKITYDKLTFGLQYWNREEGLAWFNDTEHAGTNNGNIWNPVNKLYYLKYDDTNSSKKWSIINLVLFKEHVLDENTSLAKFDRGYKDYKKGKNGYLDDRIGYRELLEEKVPEWRKLNVYLRSWQIREELKVIYSGTHFNLVSGVEARYSAIQEDYSYDAESLPKIPIHYSKDLGIYAQGNYSKNDLKVVLGGRLDYNKIDDDGGYGTVFNPRLAFLYSPKNWVFKGIYSEAFKDATSFDKYSTVPGQRDEQNPSLPPEKVKNVEMSISWNTPTTEKSWPKFFIETSAYSTNYSGIIKTVGAIGSRQNQSVGKIEIFGVQLNSSVRFSETLRLNFNYTFASPYEIPVDSSGIVQQDSLLRVADIATHKGNVILNWKFKIKKEHSFNWNNRVNISGERRTGRGTTQSQSRVDRVAPFSIWTSYLSYSNKFGLTFGLGVNNVLDTYWEVPGARDQKGRFASVIPQPGRNYFFNLRYDLW